MQIRVSRSTNVSALFGCILATLEQYGFAEISAVGASALNQMFKAVSLVFEKRGEYLRCTPRLARNDAGTSFCVMFLEVVSCYEDSLV